MKRMTGITAMAAALSLAAFSSVAMAQQSQSVMEAQAQSSLNSDAVPGQAIDTMIDVNKQISSVREEAQQKLASVDNEEQAAQIQVEAAEKMNQTVAQSGLEVDEYNQMIDLYHHDEKFQERVHKRLD